ncbi:unnamed protein product [Closterium sp. NIES-53]
MHQISTVGYGDILATNTAGRVVVMCIIVAALVILPVQLSNISNLLAHSFELRALITEYHGAVRFIQGSPMTLYDLHRVQIALASAVFILLPSLQSVSALPSPSAIRYAFLSPPHPLSQSHVLDNGQIAQALSMKRYAGPLSRLVVQMGSSLHRSDMPPTPLPYASFLPPSSALARLTLNPEPCFSTLLPPPPLPVACSGQRADSAGPRNEPLCGGAVPPGGGDGRSAGGSAAGVGLGHPPHASAQP